MTFSCRRAASARTKSKPQNTLSSNSPAQRDGCIVGLGSRTRIARQFLFELTASDTFENGVEHCNRRAPQPGHHRYTLEDQPVWMITCS